MSYSTLLRLAGKGKRGWAKHGIWPCTHGVAEPPFGAVRRGAVCLSKLRPGERGNPRPLLSAERGRGVFALVAGTLGAEHGSDWGAWAAGGSRCRPLATRLCAGSSPSPPPLPLS